MNKYLKTKNLLIDKQRGYWINNPRDFNNNVFVTKYKELNSLLDAIKDDKFVMKERLNMFEKMVQVAELDGGHDLGGSYEFDVRRVVDGRKWWAGESGSVDWTAWMGPGPIKFDDLADTGTILYIGKDVTDFVDDLPSFRALMSDRPYNWDRNLQHVLFHPESKCKIIHPMSFILSHNLVSVNLPLGLERIGEYAFQNCKSLRSFIIPNLVTSIGINAFAGCSSLESIVLSNSLVHIDEGAFENCSSLTSIIIPDSVTVIGTLAFGSCTGLTSIILPNSVTDIGMGAFEHCENLESIVLPKLFTYMQIGTFADCLRLKSIDIPNSVDFIGERAFENCKSLVKIVIPESLTSIEEQSFRGCTSLKSVIIPKSVTSIDTAAFYNCLMLETIVLPNGISRIEDGTFYDCSSLKSINIPDLVTDIGQFAFANCKSLTSVQLPNSTTVISPNAFENCESLRSINIPESVMFLGSNCFKNSGIKILNIEYSTHEFEYRAFDEMTVLTVINLIGGSHKDWLEKLDNQYFDGCTKIIALAKQFNVSVREYVVKARLLEQLNAKMFNKVTDSNMMEWMRGFSPRNL